MNCYTILVVPLSSTRKVVFLLILTACGAAHAQSWIGGVSADWSIANNWSPAGVPSGVTATVNTSSGNLATVLSAVNQQPGHLFVGDGTAGTMNLQMGGSLTVNGEMGVGNNNSGTGVFSMSGGRLTVNGWFEAGRLGGNTANGTVNLIGGAMTLTFTGIPGYKYHVQIVSTNLTSWNDVLITNAPAGGVFQFNNNASPMPDAYYRLMWNGN